MARISFENIQKMNWHYQLSVKKQPYCRYVKDIYVLCSVLEA